MTLLTKILTLSTLPLLMLVLSGLNRSSAQNPKQTKRVGLTVLQSSETLINSDYSKRPVLAPSKDGQRIYTLNSMTGDVFVYDKNSKRLRKAFESSSNVEAFAVGPQGDLYLAQLDSTVQIVNSQGRRLSKFPTLFPRSIAVLSNGNLVVASPSNGKLLHLYSNVGSLLASFGDLRTFDANQTENEFLNRGRVVVGSGDQIYYVSTYAPQPYVLRFSSEGQLLGEFQIEGEAVDLQTGLTNEFLNRREFCNSGGVTIITSATVSPETGHLWLGMNGLSTQGTVYEYDENGSKVREYALLLNSNNKQRNITHVKDIAVSSDALDVLTWGGTYSFKFSDVLIADAWKVPTKTPKTITPTWRAWANPLAGIAKFWASAPVSRPGIPQPDPACEAQTYPCTANCPANTQPNPANCGAAMAAFFPTSSTRIVTSNNCQAQPVDSTPGSATPGGCTQTVQWCDPGVSTGSTTLTVNCTAVPTPEPTPTPTPPGPANPESPPPDGGGGGGGIWSPVVIDTAGNGFNLTDYVNGVAFDLNNDGNRGWLSWTATASDDAWLTLDRNSNGLIDNGTELFGNFTAQPQSATPNGFIALAEFDKRENGGNADGAIDWRDRILSSLRLWQDTNHNGISEANELHTFGALGITGIDLKYEESKKTDAFGNKFRYRTKVYDTHGARAGRWAWDVFLIVQ